MNQQTVAEDSFFWALRSICALFRKPYGDALARQQAAAPHTAISFIEALRLLGFETNLLKLDAGKLTKQRLPLVAWIDSEGFEESEGRSWHAVVILQAEDGRLLLLKQEAAAPQAVSLDDFKKRYSGWVVRALPQLDDFTDADAAQLSRERRRFGFAWFLPELRRHSQLWQEILLASLVIQLIALATPLFTQAIIDKVIVHRTQSTLVVVVIGMAVFMLFSAVLSWLRQYLVLHTGNRVDAVLGAAVFDRLFKLPPLYFQHRPTGVIAARLHGVETVREFISSAAVTLVLDLPFLLIFAGIMLYYSVTLSLIVVAVLALIVCMSLVVAPLFQRRLQEQFQLGARNQAFITEYVAGLETVKSLQLEPQLASRYSGYLSSYLTAGFATKQLANTYNTFANLLEQLMTLLVLGIGAYTVMHSAEFTIGMLVAFQMFAGRLSQPMLRLVGLWQQFQQASLSIARLGDLMNAPVEPYSMVPARASQRKGLIQIEDIAFRYGPEAPLVYEGVSLVVLPGQTVAIMGPSGCGKSTLAKLLQGFYQPTKGRIRIDGVDIRYLAANELRSHFGVVPQETTLFSGTLYDNLQMASPGATFEQIVAACKMAEIHQSIEALPQGYQTEIGERGAGLSGGQKQRVAIARALLKRPAILVFDEATSALDGATAEQFALTINALKGKVTMLFITHGVPSGLQVDAVFNLGAKAALAPAPLAASRA